jgi:hypothetical protein
MAEVFLQRSAWTEAPIPGGRLHIGGGKIRIGHEQQTRPSSARHEAQTADVWVKESTTMANQTAWDFLGSVYFL